MADEAGRPQDARWAQDPSDDGRLRWWDGTAWTDHVVEDLPPVPAYRGRRRPGTARRRTVLVVAAPVLALLTLVGVVAGLASLGRGTDTARVVVASPADDVAEPTDAPADDTGPDLWYGPTDGPTDDAGTAGATGAGSPDGTTSAPSSTDARTTPGPGTTTGGTTTRTTGTTTGTTTAPGTTTSSTTTAPQPSSSSTTTTRPPTTTTTTAAPDDPRYRTCQAANAHGYGPYRRGVDPEYAWYPDPDGDGVACG